MCEQEEQICNTEQDQEKQEFNEDSDKKQNAGTFCYKRQFRGACLILFGILLSCYDWYEAGFHSFADFIPLIGSFCGVVGVIVAFSDGIKVFLNRLND